MKRPPLSEDSSNLIFGVHPVGELLEQRPADVDRIYVARTKGGGLGQILRLARKWGIPVSNVSTEVLSRKVSGRHQGIAAQVASVGYAKIEDLCRSNQGPEALLVLVDRVTDPGNLGSIVRTAAAAGASGLILSSNGTVGLSPAVAKSSAGTVERIPIAREPRPRRRLEALHETGFTSLLLDPRGDVGWDRLEARGPIVIVAGGEERGVSPALAEICHKHVAIPLARGVESLNVAISTGVLLFEVVRQRRSIGGGPKSL